MFWFRRKIVLVLVCSVVLMLRLLVWLKLRLVLFLINVVLVNLWCIRVVVLLLEVLFMMMVV